MFEQTYKIIVQECLDSCKTLREIDEKFTSKIFNFDNATEFYKSAASSNLLHAIKTKTMFIVALDDPITGNTCIPYEEFDKNENICLIATDAGGHIAHFTSMFSTQQWFTHPVYHFLDYAQKNK